MKKISFVENNKHRPGRTKRTFEARKKKPESNIIKNVNFYLYIFEHKLPSAKYTWTLCYTANDPWKKSQKTVAFKPVWLNLRPSVFSHGFVKLNMATTLLSFKGTKNCRSMHSCIEFQTRERFFIFSLSLFFKGDEYKRMEN